MPLVLDPDRLPEATLRELARSLRQDLEELQETVDSPRGRVLDPASLEVAGELLRSAKARLDLPGRQDRAGWAADANLAYATLLAVIDLVKSHTDVPKVPRSRSPKPA
jgi:hypothetical protein